MSEIPFVTEAECVPLLFVKTQCTNVSVSMKHVESDGGRAKVLGSVPYRDPERRDTDPMTVP